MLRKLCHGLAAGLCVLTLAACVSAPPVIKPSGMVAAVLDPEKKSSALTMRANHLLTITLPPSAPGHAWQIAFHDPRYLKQMTELKPADVAEVGTTISFVAINIGRTRLRFLLAPIGSDREVRPIDQQELVLTIQ